MAAVVPDDYYPSLSLALSQITFGPPEYLTSVHIDSQSVLTYLSTLPHLHTLDLSGCAWVQDWIARRIIVGTGVQSLPVDGGTPGPTTRSAQPGAGYGFPALRRVSFLGCENVTLAARRVWELPDDPMDTREYELGVLDVEPTVEYTDDGRLRSSIEQDSWVAMVGTKSPAASLSRSSSGEQAGLSITIHGRLSRNASESNVLYHGSGAVAASDGRDATAEARLAEKRAGKRKVVDSSNVPKGAAVKSRSSRGRVSNVTHVNSARVPLPRPGLKLELPTKGFSTEAVEEANRILKP
ncbi:hypothetical protein HDU93_005291 [Gonapodya sp. JEL0774]|nr:hypothetical protein HDU93_005291 [Gonapodya sp. JEL0774]